MPVRSRSRSHSPKTRRPNSNRGPIQGDYYRGGDRNRGRSNTNYSNKNRERDSRPARQCRGPSIDRGTTCPFLLRVHYRIDEAFTPLDFCGSTAGNNTDTPGAAGDVDTRGEDAELQLYTWLDATLREMADLVKDIAREARAPNAKLEFHLVHTDRDGKQCLSPLGTAHATRPSSTDRVSLQSQKFCIGDRLALTIHLPPLPSLSQVGETQKTESHDNDRFHMNGHTVEQKEEVKGTGSENASIAETL